MRIPDEILESVKDRDATMKQKGKEYADQRYGYKKCELDVGDIVLMTRSQKTKCQTPNIDKEFTVAEKKGPALTIVGDDGTAFIRDSSKLVPLRVARKDAEDPNLACNADHEPVDDIPLSSALFTGLSVPQHAAIAMDTSNSQELMNPDAMEQDITRREAGIQDSFHPPFAPQANSTPAAPTLASTRQTRAPRPPAWMTDYTR